MSLQKLNYRTETYAEPITRIMLYDCGGIPMAREPNLK